MWLVRKLKKVLQIPQDYSNELWAECHLSKYLKQWQPKLQLDDCWNLSIINPWTPLLCAHMDTVQKEINTSVIKTNWLLHQDWILCVKPSTWLPIKDIKNTAGPYWGILWWDDKCWVAMLMQAYEEFGDDISILFTTQEETGWSWVRHFCDNNAELLTQVPYCLVLDRKWDWDIVGHDNQYCSLAFEKKIHKILKPFGYSPTPGGVSDANKLKLFTNTVNLSVGYLNHHQYNERIVIDDFTNAYAAVCRVLEKLEADNIPIYKKEDKKPALPKPKKWKKSQPMTMAEWNKRYASNNGEIDEEENFYNDPEYCNNPELYPLPYFEAIKNPENNALYYDYKLWTLEPLEWYKFLSNNPDADDDYRVVPDEEVEPEIIDGDVPPIPEDVTHDKVKSQLIFHKDVNLWLMWQDREGKTTRISISKWQYFYYWK